MNYSIKYLRRIRENFIELMNDLTIEQLNEVPEGFNNNIIWNFGHIVTTTPAIVYIRSGVDKNIQIPHVAKYTRGSKPETFISKEELEELKQLSTSYLDKIAQDYEAGVFKTITPFATLTFKYEMDTIEEVFTCLTAHESLHWGVANGLKKVVTR